tara:strand:+ start:6251 stop:7492 length:1242 start_codon:yes stop_codon:yes gene_type:complete
LRQNSQPIDLEEALAHLLEQIQPISGIESCALADAPGRILAEAITAPISLPPFAASAMDGYALRRTDFLEAPARAFHLRGTSLAGHPCNIELGAFECARIFTGAVLPAGADQVLLQEEVTTATADEICFKTHSPDESYIRPVGNDVSAGDLLLAAGERLNPFNMAGLAAAGIVTVPVKSKPRIGIFSSGDELRPIGTSVADLGPGDIFDSNRFSLLRLFHRLPVELQDLGCIRDDPDETKALLHEAAANCDLLITSGGVSVGDADYVGNTIRELGHLNFWRINMKPGKPVAFGRIDACHILGLPGNPVSTMVTGLLLGRPALLRLCGGASPTPLAFPAKLDEPITRQPGRREYQRGTYTQTKSGITVRATGAQGSNRLSTFATANCLICVPAETASLPTGSQVDILPLFQFTE